MTNTLNLDNYKQNTQITLGGKIFTIPPITLNLRNKIANLLSKNDESDITLDLQLLLLYLNSNIDNYVFKDEDILVLNTYQVKELVTFITDQLTAIEKN